MDSPSTAAQELPQGNFFLKTLSGLPTQPKTSSMGFAFKHAEQLEITGIETFNPKVISVLSSGNIKSTYWLANTKPYIVKVKFEQAEGHITVWQIKSLH